MLRNVDGVVFVVDSQPETIDANRGSLVDLAVNLRLIGLNPDRVPVTVQYNKQDLSHALSPDELQARLAIPDEVPSVAASAKFGDGVFDTLRTVVRECVQLLGNPQAAPEGRSPSVLPGRRASMYPGTVAGAQVPVIPKQPHAPNLDDLADSDKKPASNASHR